MNFIHLRFFFCFVEQSQHRESNLFPVARTKKATAGQRGRHGGGEKHEKQFRPAKKTCRHLQNDRRHRQQFFSDQRWIPSHAKKANVTVSQDI